MLFHTTAASFFLLLKNIGHVLPVSARILRVLCKCESVASKEKCSYARCFAACLKKNVGIH